MGNAVSKKQADQASIEGSTGSPAPASRAARTKIARLNSTIKALQAQISHAAHAKESTPASAPSHLCDDSQELLEHWQVRLAPGGNRLPLIPPMTPRLPGVDCGKMEYTIEPVAPAFKVKSCNSETVIVAKEISDLLWRVVVTQGGRRVGAGVSGVLGTYALRHPEMSSVPVVNDKGGVIAVFNVATTIIGPFAHPDNSVGKIQRMKVKGAHIGHRGGGAGYDPTTFTVENTMQSFLAAARRGASFIEFDVQLTADNVPIIAHDFEEPMVKVSENGVPLAQAIGPWSTSLRSLSAAELADMRPAGPELKGMDQEFLTALMGRPELKRSNSLSALPRIKAGSPSIKTRGNDLRVALTDRFATLEQVLTQTPVSVGFDVEIKYPEEEHVVLEYNYPSRNEIVNATLKTVFDCAGERSIFFSSFDPDVCIMLNIKQHRYPVFFLTEGGKTTNYTDPRLNSLEAAVDFASKFHLEGVVTECTPILKKPALVKEIVGRGLSLFTYGHGNNDPKNVEKQLKAGVHAIISDRATATPKGKAKEDPRQRFKRQPTRVTLVWDHEESQI